MSPLEAWKQLGYRILEIEQAAKDVNNIAVRINKALVGSLDSEDDGTVRGMLATRFERSGPGWPGLAPKTIQQRVKLGFAAGPMLVRSTTLAMAAIGGIATVTPDTITVTLKDGAAPRYSGGGKARRRRINKIRARAIDKARAIGQNPVGLGRSGRISDYAERLNAVRPFYGAASGEELQKLVAARNDWIDRVVLAIDSGQSLNSIGLPL